MSTETQTEMLAGTRIIPIEVPTDMVASSGPWDDFSTEASSSANYAAAHYGPILESLNPKADLAEIRAELAEHGMDRDWATETDETVWEYVAWSIACDRMERGDDPA